MPSGCIMHNRAWVRQITGGITVPGMHEYLLLWDRLLQVHATQLQRGLIDSIRRRHWTADRRQCHGTGCGRALLPLRPRPKTHRPHDRILLLLSTSLVDHPSRAQGRHTTDGRSLPARMVGPMAMTMARRQEKGCR